MGRKKILAGNWKMHMTIGEAKGWLDRFGPVRQNAPTPEVVIFPPFTALAPMGTQAEQAGVDLGGQNLHESGAGAFTGEISAAMLVDAGATWVLVGHSERRSLFGETDDRIREKVIQALDTGLNTILCVGETWIQREAGEAVQVVTSQLEKALPVAGSLRLDRLCIAYEPVWAIGTGKTATPADAQEMHKTIRQHLAGCMSAVFAGQIPLLYGGSVKPENAADLFACPDIDGALVGGASLDPETFGKILLAA